MYIVNNDKCDSRYILYQCTKRSVQMSNQYNVVYILSVTCTKSQS